MALAQAGGRPLTEYLFVDGGCLRSFSNDLSKRYFNQPNAIKIDFSGLRSRFAKVFYYDAVPGQKHGEGVVEWQLRIEPEASAFNEIRSLSGFHVRLGDVRGHGSSKRQKRVDVQIAVDMLMHTFRANMDGCTLLTGDLDFQPLIEALVREGMFIDLWHPSHAALDLTSAADNAITLSIDVLEGVLKREDGSAVGASTLR